MATPMPLQIIAPKDLDSYAVLRKMTPEHRALLWATSYFHAEGDGPQVVDALTAAVAVHTGMQIHRHKAAAIMRALAKKQLVRADKRDGEEHARWQLELSGLHLARFLRPFSQSSAMAAPDAAAHGSLAESLARTRALA